DRLAELDSRMSAWMSLARRYRRPPAELPALLAQWQQELGALDAASDLAALESAAHEAEAAYRKQAQQVSAARARAAAPLADAVTHLAQVAACADRHYVVSKSAREGKTESDVQRVRDDARVAEVARMLGARATGTSLAHAQEMLAAAEEAPARKPQRSRAS